MASMSFAILTTLTALRRFEDATKQLGQKTEHELNKLFGEVLQKSSQPQTESPTDLRNTEISWRMRFAFVRISAVVFGIELCYAAETAFVSPIVARLGVPVSLLTLCWSVSPLLGFVLLSILGSLSDQCSSSLGRRRPFIIALSSGIMLGLFLIPAVPSIYYSNISLNGTNTDQYRSSAGKQAPNYIIWLTILGIGILDSCCDGCQSPSRALLLDVVPPKCHTAGLSVFTVLSGIGGACGYIIGGVEWKGNMIETLDLVDRHFFHECVVFGIIGGVFVVTLMITLTSVKETPLKLNHIEYEHFEDSDMSITSQDAPSTGVTRRESQLETIAMKAIDVTQPISGLVYLKSMIRMPRSLLILCLTNLFSWMSLVCYSLFFTHFVGEVVYEGSPLAPRGSFQREAYESGVRMGSFAMAVYSSTCCLYSLLLQRIISYLGIRLVYIISLLCGAIGIFFIGVFQNVPACFLFSVNVGILYATLFTIPYILVAGYHTSSQSEYDDYHEELRGLGTDITLVSSMVFIGQFTVSLTTGLVVFLTGTTTTICWSSAVFGVIAAFFATQVHYN